MPTDHHRVTFKPFRVKAWDDDLRTTVIRQLGYRAVCSCGERSKVQRSKRDLRTWKRTHLHHVG